MSTEQNIDKNRLSSAQKARATGGTPDENRRNIVGAFCAPMQRPKPSLIRSKSELSIESEDLNASIVFTPDRPRSILSGYGAAGHQKCSTIDIVAGRISPMATTTVIVDGKEQRTAVDPNFQFDAARIYISEKTDIDKNFKLRENTKHNFVPNSVGRSAIGLKADSIRIIGNEGVRLVTGVYPNNSRTTTKGSSTPAGIELVALNGNKQIFEVQPFVKGDSMVKCVFALKKMILKLNGLVSDLLDEQEYMNGLLSDHDHVYTGGPVTQAPGLVKPDAFAEVFDITDRNIKKIKKKLKLNMKNMKRFETIYLTPGSEHWICSKYNGTN